jgi:hypothetical protein
VKKLKDKALCKLVKADALERALDAYKKLVVRPAHLCTKCGRVSNNRDRLCEPEKLEPHTSAIRLPLAKAFYRYPQPTWTWPNPAPHRRVLHHLY